MLRVVAYHRVADFCSNPCVDDRSISATPSVFREQMRHLARYYRCISLPEVLEAVDRKTPLPRRAVLITFDDAYSDFAAIAWPILRKFGLTATVFVPTAFASEASRVFWWDKLYRAFCRTKQTSPAGSPIGPLRLDTQVERQRSLRRLQDYVATLESDEATQLVDAVCVGLVEGPIVGGNVLSWSQLRCLAKEGLTLASHTQTHLILAQASANRIREEISGSQEDLRREIGMALPVFCYPNGNYNDRVIRILQEEGMKLAFTTIPSWNDLHAANHLKLGRTCITPRSSAAIFGARLLSLGVQFDAWRHRKLKAMLGVNVPYIQTECASS